MHGYNIEAQLAASTASFTVKAAEELGAQLRAGLDRLEV